MSDKPLPNLKPVLYAHRVHELQAVLYSCGYALALHGSMQRDLDAIAVPWRLQCDSAPVLIQEVCKKMGLTIGPNSPTEKEHGRRVWTLMLKDIGFIDLSVMPRVALPSFCANCEAPLSENLAERVIENGEHCCCIDCGERFA